MIKVKFDSNRKLMVTTPDIILVVQIIQGKTKVTIQENLHMKDR